MSAAKAWPWTGPIFVISISLAGFRVISSGSDLVSKVLAQKSSTALIFTVNERATTAWWAPAEQPDGSVMTQVQLAFVIHNRDAQSRRITRLEVRRPLFIRSGDITDLVFLCQDRTRDTFGSENHIFQKSTVNACISGFIARTIGKSGSPLSVTFKLTDQLGQSYKVKAKLSPAP